MRIRRFNALFLLSSVVTCLAADTTAGRKIYVNIVGEIYAPAATYASPTAEAPAYFVMHDAGCMEWGDPMANDEPPAAREVIQSLFHYLPAAHFQPANTEHAPTLLLITQWGVIREDSMEVSPPFEIRKNLRARIRLVATPEIARRIEGELTDRIHRKTTPQIAPWPSMLTNLEQVTLDIAKDGHYFVIVTAYDYAAAIKHQVAPVWRLKLSTYDRGTGMVDALPALIRNGHAYFGRSTAEPVNDKMPLLPPTQVRLGDLKFLDDIPPAESGVASDFLKIIAQRESAELKGEKSKPAQDR